VLSSDSDDNVPLPRRPALARVNTVQLRPPQVLAACTLAGFDYAEV